jgi:hypothetical protein
MTGRKTLLDASAGRFKKIVGRATGTTKVIAGNELALTSTQREHMKGTEREREKDRVSGIITQERGRGGLKTAIALRESDSEEGKGMGKQSQISSLFMRTGEQEGFIPWLMGEESKISGNIRSEGTRSRIKKGATLGTEADVNAVMDEMKARGMDDQETLDKIRDELMSQLPWTSIFASMGDKIKSAVGMEVEKPELFDTFLKEDRRDMGKEDMLASLGMMYKKSPEKIPGDLIPVSLPRIRAGSLRDQMILRDNEILQKYMNWEDRKGYRSGGDWFAKKMSDLPKRYSEDWTRLEGAQMRDQARRLGKIPGLSPEYLKAHPILGPDLPPQLGPDLPPQQVPSQRSFQGLAGDRLLELDKKSQDRAAEQQTSTGGGAVVVTDQSSVVNQTSPVFMPKADTSNDSAMTQRSFG